MMLEEERLLLSNYGRKLLDHGLVKGTGGNLSCYNRKAGLIAVTPSGLDYYETTPEDILILDSQGAIVEKKPGLEPTSEVNMHLSIYRERPDVSGIVHTHSLYATAISCMGWSLKPVHYLAALGGDEVRCTPYSTYGSKELAEACLMALGSNFAALLSNHGLICVADSLPNAFSKAEHLEYVAQLQCVTQSLGGARELNHRQMQEVMAKLEVHPYR